MGKRGGIRLGKWGGLWVSKGGGLWWEEGMAMGGKTGRVMAGKREGRRGRLWLEKKGECFVWEKRGIMDGENVEGYWWEKVRVMCGGKGRVMVGKRKS